MILTVDELTGGYSAVPVLKKLSFTVDQGELVGLIGLNGAGKSTTIKHVIGLLKPKKGKITLNDCSLLDNPAKYKQQFAYVPETPVLYEELTLKDHLEMTIMAYGLERKKAMKKASELLKIFRLENKLDWFPANFSKGMKQKVMIVCAFMTDAKLFIIDEPFLVLMSTHVLSTAEKYCDRFVMIDHGKLQASGTLEELKQNYGREDATLSDVYLGMADLEGE